MKTNRDVRLSLSEAILRDMMTSITMRDPFAGRRVSVALGSGEVRDAPHKRGWTPAPDPASLRRMEPVKKPARDYEALTKAALRKPVGYWEDAPRGLQFVKGAKVEVHPGGCECMACAALSSPVSDAERRALAYKGQYAIPDGARGDPVWQGKWIAELSIRSASLGVCGVHLAGVGTFYPKARYNCILSELEAVGMREGRNPYFRAMADSEALAWLDANGHKAHADELRQSRKQVEGRVWKTNNGMFTWALIGSSAYLFGGPSKATEAWEKFKIVDAGELIESMRKRQGDAVELHGPEADAIIRECAKAMGL